jgi:hypothetical protein
VKKEDPVEKSKKISKTVKYSTTVNPSRPLYSPKSSKTKSFHGMEPALTPR